MSHTSWLAQTFTSLQNAYSSKTVRRLKTRGRRLTPVELLEPRVVLAANPLITEFVASNDDGLRDEDGEDSDWIELHNAGDESMSLANWYLTDNADDLTKWRFPDVQLGVGEYLVVFASSKDRVDPLAPLHTNFNLATDGEYLALVRPDGLTVQYEYAPAYPQQVTDVAYGIPSGTAISRLVEPGATAQVHIPTSGALDPESPGALTGTWLDPSINDTGPGWFTASTGIGYEGTGGMEITADSVAEFSGVQGQDGWHYGQWTRLKISPNAPYGPNNFFAYSEAVHFRPATNKWDSVEGGPPNIEITSTGATPGSLTSPAFMFIPIRRWVSDVSGDAVISGTLNNPDPSGDGVVARIFVGGTEIYTQHVNGTSLEYSIEATLAAGVSIDFILDPGPGNDDIGDTTEFTVQVGVEAGSSAIAFADSSADWSTDGEQGANGWTYGYYDRLADPDRTYDSGAFTAFPDSYWTGSVWDWPNGNPPWTTIEQTGVHPNGTNHPAGGPLHWAIRRWQADVSGNLTVEWRMWKTNAAGDGVTGRIFHNGVEIDSATIAGNNTAGVTRVVAIPNVQIGDFIDIVHDPTGVGGNPLSPNDGSDGSAMTAVISGVPSLEPDIATDVEMEMRHVNSGAYIRIPFTVDSPSAFDTLTLRMKYDDGFVAYLNGQRIADANAPAEPAWDSAATANRNYQQTAVPQSYNVSEDLHLLVAGENVLQIHLLNVTADDRDVLVIPELFAGTLSVSPTEQRYFLTPTPGEGNGFGTDDLPPIILDVTHTPNVPTTADPIVVTADVAETFSPVSTVTLNYQVMYGSIQQVAMVDDGSGADLVAGDGLYTGVIPAGAGGNGQMVRWFVTATDTESLHGRFPMFRDPQDSEEFRGTIYLNEPIDTDLPVLHIFLQDTCNPGDACAAITGGGDRGSVFYNGQFYDNVQFDLHGQSSQGFATNKKSMDVDFTGDHRFELSPDLPLMKDFNLLTNYADKSKLRNTLAYGTRAMTGEAAHLAFPIRVQQNGEFFAVYDFVEDGDDRYLERVGLDPEGALYKIYNTFTTAAGAERKAGGEENNADLQAFITGLNQTGAALTNFIYDNVDLATMANYLAGFTLTSNRDCCHKNFYAYRDTHGNGEWSFLPWDADLSYGRNWGGFDLAYHDYTIYYDNGLHVGSNNHLIQRLYAIPEFQEMYHRRIRSILDELFGPPGASTGIIESWIQDLREQIGADGDLDHTKWGQVASGSPQQPLRTWNQAVDEILNEYLAPRRNHLYNEATEPELDSILLSGVPGATTAKFTVPTDNSLGVTWTQVGFDDSSWSTGAFGIGYETSPADYAWLISTPMNPTSVNPNAATVMARTTFDVADPSSLDGLTLQMKYDDGFVAWINGVEVARSRAPQTVNWNSLSTADRPDSENGLFESFHIADLGPLNLQSTGNVLAIQSLNSSLTSSDMVIVPRLVRGIVTGHRGDVPFAQPTEASVAIGAIDFNPVSANQDEEFIEIVNNNSYAIDISGWQVANAVEMTFRPGTVIPAGESLYITPSAVAFRDRETGPSGGQGLFVQDSYSGHLSNFGETIEVYNKAGTLITSHTYVGNVSPQQENLRITEVMYHPLDPSATELAVDPTFEGDDFEYIEVQNISESDTVDLDGVKFSAGVTFDFSGSSLTSLAPGARALVVSDRAAFEARYGTALGSMIAGEFASGTLSNNGERLVLDDATNSTVVEIDYTDDPDDGWSARADGRGSSLQLIDVSGDSSSPVNWRPSTEINGSPGAAEMAPIQSLIINEVFTNTDAPAVDAIELFNISGTPQSIEHYFLSDSADTIDELRGFVIPAQSVPANGYLVFDETDFNASGGVDPSDFALGSDGDELYLTVGDASGPRFFVDDVQFGAAALGESIGRWPNGGDVLSPMTRVSLGYDNSFVRVGPMVISEVQYNPGDPSQEALDVDPNLLPEHLEFIEVHNPTTQAVDLTNWRIRGGADFDFAPGTTLPAGGSLVIVPFDPSSPVNAARSSAFRTHYGIDTNVTILGGDIGQLSDGGERLTLQRPGTPPPDDPLAIPRWVEDEVRYEDADPWPTEADGAGSSLSRIAPIFAGNDATTWSAETPSPGSVNFASDIAGDFSNDGDVNSTDIDILLDVINAGHQVAFMDLDSDTMVDAADLTHFLQVALETRAGDTDLNGMVDASDFNRWNQNRFTQYGGTWARGDFNGDGSVDGRDFNIWNANKFLAAPAALGGVSGRTPRAPLAIEPVGQLAPLDLAFAERDTLVSQGNSIRQLLTSTDTHQRGDDVRWMPPQWRDVTARRSGHHVSQRDAIGLSQSRPSDDEPRFGLTDDHFADLVDWRM